MTNNASAPYRNPSLPIAERVADLLARMTLEEKAAQLGALWMNDLIDQDTFVGDKAQALMPHSIGQVVRPAGGNPMRPLQVAAATAATQAWLAANTRLGIPAMI